MTKRMFALEKRFHGLLWKQPQNCRNVRNYDTFWKDCSKYASMISFSMYSGHENQLISSNFYSPFQLRNLFIGQLFRSSPHYFEPENVRHFENGARRKWCSRVYHAIFLKIKSKMTSECVFKFLRRRVDGKHLMRFQSETSVFKFLVRSIDGAKDKLCIFC